MRGGARPGDEGGAAAPPFCAVSAPPQPVCEVGPLGGHRAPSAGKTQHRAQQIRAADRGALHPGAFWTAPAPCRLDGARLRRILDRPTRKMLHPVVEAALPPPWFGGAPGARFGGAFRAHDRSHGAGNHLLSRQPPGSSRASPGHNHRVRGTLYPESPGSSRASPGRNHLLGQATTYWGRKIAYPNAQFPTPMPGPGAGGARSPVWRSKMRLSSRLERGLVERMVQNASESARIRPDPAQIAKLRRILDRPRAMPPERGETETDFGPPPPGARRFTQL